jgi:hypothetical protein
MITKEIAALIFRCYVEIEEGGKMITELKSALNEKGEFELKDTWGNSRGLELHLPTSMSGAKIKRVPFQLALDVIQHHIADQQKELERLKEVCRIQLA